MKWVFLVVVLFALVGGVFLFYFSGSSDEGIGEVYFGEESEDGGLGDLGGSDGGSVGGEEGEDTLVGEGGKNSIGGLDEGCFEQQVSYSIKKFEEEYFCNDYSEGECLEESVFCSAEVSNLDEVSGDFLMETKFLTKDFEEIHSVEDSFFLEEGESYFINESFVTDRVGEVVCFYSSVEVPMKEIC